MPLVPDPVARGCRQDYPAFHHSGNRQPHSIRYIILHSTQGPSAGAAARWFMNPASGGSSNLVLDGSRCYMSLRDDVIPWGAPPLNTLGFHIEQAGFARWTRRQWLVRRLTVRRAAYKAALRCRWYGIPPVELDVAALVKDFGSSFQGNFQPGPLRGGIVTHATVSAAFHESDHTDPGAGYPMDVFLSYLTGFLAKLEPRT